MTTIRFFLRCSPTGSATLDAEGGDAETLRVIRAGVRGVSVPRAIRERAWNAETRYTPADVAHGWGGYSFEGGEITGGEALAALDAAYATTPTWQEKAREDMARALDVLRRPSATLTSRDRADGEAIRSIHDREAYVALGRLNTTPGGTDFDTLAWALSGTVARVADAATEQELAQVLAWVREGEGSR